nr:unnamed protein product [Digitaria exilis]
MSSAAAAARWRKLKPAAAAFSAAVAPWVGGCVWVPRRGGGAGEAMGEVRTAAGEGGGAVRIELAAAARGANRSEPRGALELRVLQCMEEEEAGEVAARVCIAGC